MQNRLQTHQRRHNIRQGTSPGNTTVKKTALTEYQQSLAVAHQYITGSSSHINALEVSQCHWLDAGDSEPTIISEQTYSLIKHAIEGKFNDLQYDTHTRTPLRIAMVVTTDPPHKSSQKTGTGPTGPTRRYSNSKYAYQTTIHSPAHSHQTGPP